MKTIKIKKYLVQNRDIDVIGDTKNRYLQR
jgi:hypothetical protein